jgi:hypothetical protein
MKNIKAAGHIFLASAFIMLCASAGPAQADRQIAAIRAEVSLINKNAPKYSRDTRSVDGLSLEGAEAVYFSSGGVVKKATAKVYGETFRATAELFYKNGELIFAFQRLEKYDTHVAANPPPSVTQAFETRVYFSGGKAVRVIEDKKQLSPASTEFRGAEQGINDLSEKVRAALGR